MPHLPTYLLHHAGSTVVLNLPPLYLAGSTDVLSFPFHDSAVALDGDFPGGKAFVKGDDDANLGDVMVSVPYV